MRSMVVLGARGDIEESNLDQRMTSRTRQGMYVVVALSPEACVDTSGLSFQSYDEIELPLVTHNLTRFAKVVHKELLL